MRLTPRYEGPPLLSFEGDLDDPSLPLLRQRRRLAEACAGFDEEAWTTPSRCAGWSVKDVLTHLVSTNQFWAFSIGAARAGQPTRFLATFDPVASPVELVAAAGDQPGAAVLERFAASNDALADAVAGADDATWRLPGEAPPGHVPLHEVVLHALWDSWIHERDVLVPLGREQVLEVDEVGGCLRYVAALGPAMNAAMGATRPGTFAVEATDPDVSFAVTVGETVLVHPEAPAGVPVLAGRALELIEGLSFRADAPLGFPADARWMLAGLDRVFDLTA